MLPVSPPPIMPLFSALLRSLSFATLCAIPALGAGVQDSSPARAGETTLSWEEVDRLLLDRHALSESGREALLHLIKSRLLDVLARETGLEVAESTIDERVTELERELRMDPRFPRGLADMLAGEGMSMATFRDFLRLAVVQETLARRALGIPSEQPITGEQQEMWLESVIAERGLEELPDPWDDGVVCRLGELTITRAEFLVHLRSRTDAGDIRDGCYQLLLRKRIRARMPDLSPAALKRAVEAEILRRKNKVRADPRYQGVDYERLLAAQGIRVDAWAEDPSVQIAALARLWVERSFSADDMKRVYADEREYFDGLFGEAVETWIVFLNAVKFENDLQQRSFDEAHRQLLEAGEAIATRAEFQALAETPVCSAYQLSAREPERRAMLVLFCERAELRSLTTALASCAAKYAREVCMGAFNRYFEDLQPGLRPTAGYTSDGRRWLRDAAGALERAGLPRELLIRER